MDPKHMCDKYNEQSFQVLVEGIKDYAIFMLDPEGHITTWNEGARRFKGYQAEEIIGKHISVFYTEEDIRNGKVEHELQEATSEGRTEDEGWRVRKDGTKFWANVILTRINDKSGNLGGFVKITRDLTERKKMENQIREANENLERKVEERTRELQKAIQMRDEFISIASHELRTPLTTMRLQAQMIIWDYHNQSDPLESRLLQFAKTTDQQVDRLLLLVEDMLDATRIERGKFVIRAAQTQLSKLVTEVIHRFQPELEKAHCLLETSIESGIEGCLDPSRIEQVVINLVSNAVKYGRGRPVKITLKKENEKFVFTIKDHGIGIAPADQERIFKRFERAISANEVSGLGLGLYITREILAAHQGTIQVASQLHQGAEFTVQVPLRPKVHDNQHRGVDYEF